MHLNSNLFSRKIGMNKNGIKFLQANSWMTLDFFRSCHGKNIYRVALFGQGRLLAITSFTALSAPIIHALEPFRMIACKEIITSWSWVNCGRLEQLLFGIDRLLLPHLHQLNKS